jgi:hypothetical protein
MFRLFKKLPTPLVSPQRLLRGSAYQKLLIDRELCNVFNVSENENRIAYFSWIAALKSTRISASCSPLFSGPELVFQSNLKSYWRAQRLDANGVYLSTNSAEKDIESSDQVAKNRPQDLSVKETSIRVTRAYIPPSTLLLSRALRHSPSFEAFAEGVLCLGMLSDLAFQSFAGLG